MTRQPTTPSAGERRHAVILGASFAGMVAARVLAQRFERVTVLERDALPAGQEPRRGCPQAAHLHVLLLRGLRELEALFPGLSHELVASGAVPIDAGRDLAWLTPQGWNRPFETALEMLAMSRDHLDAVLRRRLRAFEQVAICDRCDVLSLLGDARRVTGVEILEEGAAATRELGADLVVDCTGRGSRLPGWLEELGLARPPEVRIDAGLTYSSRLYRRRKEAARPWKALFVQAAPPGDPRAAVLFPIEGDRWILSLAGGDGQQPPAEPEALERYVGALRTPAIAEALSTAEPLGPVVTYRATVNRLRQLDRIEMPEGLVALGDSVCALNPVYGQGMTVATLSALELGKRLDSARGRSITRRFQRQVARLAAGPFTLACAEDARYREARGTRLGLKTRGLHRFVDIVVAASTVDRSSRVRWLEVFHMLRSPARLVHPVIAGGAIRWWWSRRSGRGPAERALTPEPARE